MKVKILILLLLMFNMAFALPRANAHTATRKIAQVVTNRLSQRVPGSSTFPTYVTDVIFPMAALGSYGVVQNGTVHKTLLKGSIGVTSQGLSKIFSILDLGLRLPEAQINTPKDIIEKTAERIALTMLNPGVDSIVAYALIQDALTGLLLWVHQRTADNSITVILPGRDKPVPVNNLSGVFTLARVIEASTNPQVLRNINSSAATSIELHNDAIEEMMFYEPGTLPAVSAATSMERFAFVVYDAYLRNSLMNRKKNGTGYDARILSLFKLYKSYCSRLGNDLDSASELRFSSWLKMVGPRFEQRTLTYEDLSVSVFKGRRIGKF